MDILSTTKSTPASYSAAAETRLSGERIDDHPGLIRALDEVLPAVADRSEPLLLEVAVSPGTTFHP